MTIRRYRRGTRRAHDPQERNVRLYVIFPALVLLAILSIGACSSTSDEAANSSETKIQLAPASQLSGKVKQAPPVVQEAYQFAIANPEYLEQFPCYCGCGGMGHMSNLDCFVEEFHADGSITFDDHALG